MECLLPYLCMVTVTHNIIMVGLERMLNYRCRIGKVSLYMYVCRYPIMYAKSPHVHTCVVCILMLGAWLQTF